MQHKARSRVVNSKAPAYLCRENSELMPLPNRTEAIAVDLQPFDTKQASTQPKLIHTNIPDSWDTPGMNRLFPPCNWAPLRIKTLNRRRP